MVDRHAAKELLRTRDWLLRADQIVERGKDGYLAAGLLQEAGDSLMMKLGEAANRLSRLGVDAPDSVDWALAVANRNVIIHQYDAIDREQTWPCGAAARNVCTGGSSPGAIWSWVPR